nr:hypothetical protein [uncultured Oscillibacter sp.]
MRKRRALAWLLCAALLAGCQGGSGPKAADPISQESLSQDLRDALEEEWEAWNALSEEAQVVSSHMPGWCQRGFEDWAAGEAFLGFPVPNPLEDSDWLEKGTYVAMPLGFQEAPRVDIQWYGTEEGYVDWVSAGAGYRSGPTRVMLSAHLYGDPAKARLSDRDWTLDLGKQETDGVLHVIPEDTKRYCSRTAYLIWDGVLYQVHIVGEPGEKTEVEEILERALEAFSEEPE